jgi:hypothetical protein
VPYSLHETNAYCAWLEAARLDGLYRTTTEEELRDTGQYRVVTPAAYAEELRTMGEGAFAFLHPMVGGVPPAMAWEHLDLYADQVLPALSGP